MQPTTTTLIESVPKEKTYLVQLDGLRFIAVTLVMVDHWLGETNIIPIGYFGVNMFFVLSGFLITRILITSKQRDQELKRGPAHSLKAFYIRRSLRIFPIYYITILVLAAINFQAVRMSFWWLVTYTQNIWIVVHKTWLGAIDHLWSLAVEEQYYIFFPFLVLITPRRYLPHLLFGLIALAIGLRLIFYLNHSLWIYQFVLTPTCMDAFGMGGILAYLFVFNQDRFNRLVRNNYLLWGSFLLLLVNVYFMEQFLLGTRRLTSDVLARFFMSLFSAFMIGRAIVGFGQPMKWLLQNKVTVYLGQISYGLYLFHNLVYNYYHTQPTYPTLRVWNKAAALFPVLTSTPLLQLSYFYVLTVLVAAISWHFIEKPINSLKDKFSY